MDVVLREVENNIGEIEVGDAFYSGNSDRYFIVVNDWVQNNYYLQCISDYTELYSRNGKHKSLESLRQDILKYENSLNFVHYPAKEYRLELVKK